MIRPTKVVGACALTLALLLPKLASAEETKGTIKTVDPTKNEVILKGLIKNTTYELNKDAVVRLDGVRSKLGELKEGDHAVVAYQQKGDHLMATEVRGLRNAQETTGTVRGVFADKKEITLKGLVRDTTYELDKSANVSVNGKRGALTDLREGDDVLITYQQKGDHYMAAHVRATRK